MMNLSFSFSYHKDRIRVWPWLWFLNLIGKIGNENCFHSESYGEYFNHFSDYWQQVGRKSALLEVIQRKKGLVVEGRGWKEVLMHYARSKYPDKAVVTMFDIHPDSIGRTIGKLSGIDSKVFLEDVVFIPFNNRSDALKLARALPGSLCESVIIFDGSEVSFEIGSTGWENM